MLTEGSPAPAGAEAIQEAPFYIPATASAARPRRTLKHDDTFLVVDAHGDIGASAGGPDGLFHADTRFLSRFEIQINGMQLLMLGSNVRDDNAVLKVDLTNPDIFFDKRLILEKTRCTSIAPSSCGAIRCFSGWRCATMGRAP